MTLERAADAPPPGAWHNIHKALADPLRIRLLEALWETPRSARELADFVSLPPDRLYYHLGRLERAGLIRVAEYQPRAHGRVERVYAPAEVEPPGDAGPEEAAAFFAAVLDATNVDVGAAFRAKLAGRRREVEVHRSALRLTDEALAELREHIARLSAAGAGASAGDAGGNGDGRGGAGTWVRLVVALVDLQDRGAEGEADAEGGDGNGDQSEHEHEHDEHDDEHENDG